MPPLSERKLAAFGYLWILSFAVYAKHKDKKFVHDHALQGMAITIVSAVAVFIPLDILVIAIELLCAVLCIIGFYRAYHGEEFSLLPAGIRAQQGFSWFATPTTPDEPIISSRGEQERAFVAYIPFVSLWLLSRGEVSPFVRVHCLYALWIQGGIAAIGGLLWLPPMLLLITGALGSAYGMVRALQGESTLFAHSSQLLGRWSTLEELWIALGVWIGQAIARLNHNTPEVSWSDAHTQQYMTYQMHKSSHHERLHETQQSPLYAQWSAYMIGPFALLFARTPLVLHHVVQGTVLILLAGCATALGNEAFLYLIGLLWVWFVLQVWKNTVTLLPATMKLEQYFLSILFPPRHE